MPLLFFTPENRNGRSGKRRLLFVRRMETENFRLSAANRKGKRTLVFLGRQTVNGYRRLLFNLTCLSMVLANDMLTPRILLISHNFAKNKTELPRNLSGLCILENRSRSLQSPQGEY
jgi:hypothetical protein